MIAGENKNIDKLSKVNNIFDSKEWTLEDNVNDWVKSEFTRISQRLYTVESAMSEYLKDAIQRGVIIKRKEHLKILARKKRNRGSLILNLRHLIFRL